MIPALILAAGESSRMGRDKALLEFRGKTFLEHIVATLSEAGLERAVVVLGHHADEIRRAVNLRSVEIVVNQEYRLGQTSSLQAGLRAVDQDQTDAIVLCLVDHPAVSAEVVRKLVAAYQQSSALVVVPIYQGRRGHPVVISRALFKELLSLDPQQGANTVIHKYRDAMQSVEVQDPGILIDIDDPQSYRRMTS